MQGAQISGPASIVSTTQRALTTMSEGCVESALADVGRMLRGRDPLARTLTQ
jgi:hypothetical protein